MKSRIPVPLALGAFFTSSVSGSSSPFLNFSSPAPYIFSSVHGLLQQWSNTFSPNGHTIAACTIPVHTLFYHGRHDAAPPQSPEWLSFDVEMAYGIMGSLPNSRMLTYRTTRPVKCLYFDGMSANLMGTGTEAQMTFLYGDSESVPSTPPWPGRPGRPDGPDGPGRGSPGNGPSGDRPRHGQPGHGPLDAGSSREWPPRGGLEDEYFRAEGLCNWIEKKGLGGRGWGFEGIVRMNAAFELIWCDFESPSLRLMYNVNVSVPRIDMQERRWSEEQGTGDSPARPMVGQVALTDHSNNLHTSDSREGPHGPGMTDPKEPFRGIANWMWFTAATRRYGSTGNQGAGPGRGESRARLDNCGLFSFYDPALQGQDFARVEAERKSLNISADGHWHAPKDEQKRGFALEQLMRRRRPHRTNHVSKEDGAFMRAAVEQRLRAVLETESGSENASCSGIDWHLTAQEIVTFYSVGLRDLLELLKQAGDGSEQHWLATRNWLQSVRMQTHWFMMPYFEYPAWPYTNESLAEDFSIDSLAAEAALSRCRAQYSTSETQSLLESELLLSWATEETLGGICRSVFEVGMAVEYEWLANFNNDPETPRRDAVSGLSVLEKARGWKMTIEELMAWLGWVEQWTGCEGPCASNELCYIPMWPVARNMPDHRRPPGDGEPHIRNPPGGPPGWADMDEKIWHPVCMNASAYP